MATASSSTRDRSRENRRRALPRSSSGGRDTRDRAVAGSARSAVPARQRPSLGRSRTAPGEVVPGCRGPRSTDAGESRGSHLTAEARVSDDESRPDPHFPRRPAAERLDGQTGRAVRRHHGNAMQCLAFRADCDRPAGKVEVASGASAEDDVVRVAIVGGEFAETRAVAAAALIAIVAVPLLRRRDTSAVARLVAAAPRSARVVEARLTLGFAWARYRGSARSTAAGTGVDAEALELTAPRSAYAVSRPRRQITPHAHRASGRSRAC